MNRRLQVLASTLALCCFAAPAYSMTAIVSGSTPPPTAPRAPGAAKTGAAATNAATGTTTGATTNAGSMAMPNAASLTRPSAVLSPASVPAKATAVPARSGTSRSAPGPISPGRGTQTAAATPVNTTWAASSDSSSGMRKGTLQAISPGGGTFTVYGQKLTFNPQQVKVFNAGGKPASVYGLKSGASIRFTMDTTDLKHRRVAVIYIK